MSKKTFGNNCYDFSNHRNSIKLYLRENFKILQNRYQAWVVV